MSRLASLCTPYNDSKLAALVVSVQCACLLSTVTMNQTEAFIKRLCHLQRALILKMFGHEQTTLSICT